MLEKNLRTMRAVYWIDVSDSSGASSAGLFRSLNGVIVVRNIKQEVKVI